MENSRYLEVAIETTCYRQDSPTTYYPSQDSVQKSGNNLNLVQFSTNEAGIIYLSILVDRFQNDYEFCF